MVDEGVPTVAGDGRTYWGISAILLLVLLLVSVASEASFTDGPASAQATPAPQQAASTDTDGGSETKTADPDPVAVEVACPDGEVLPARFDDVPTAGAHAPQIDCLWWYGLASGRADGTFRPLADVSRAAFATLLARLLEEAGAELPGSPPDAFTDDDASVHEPALDLLSALGIMGGSGDGTVHPSWPVKRGQLASMLVAAWPQLTGETLPRDGNRFPDDDGTMHEEALDRLGTVGLLLGDGDGNVLPQATGTRAQLATLLARVLARTVDAGAVAPPTVVEADPVSGTAEVKVVSVDPNPSVYAVDDVEAVDQDAVDAFVGAITGWLDGHLTALAAGDTGQLDPRLVAPVTHERWRAATTDLVWRAAPSKVRYHIEVAELGAPQWASVEVVVTRDGAVAIWELLVVPAGEDVIVLADGTAATEGADGA